MKKSDRRQTVAPHSVLFIACGWNLWPVPACLMKPAPHNEGLSPFSVSTFTLTSLLRHTERFLLIRGRLFPSVWAPRDFIGCLVLCWSNLAQKCQQWCVLCGSMGWVHLSTGGLEVVLSTCWCLCSYSESHVNDFPGSAAFFCLHKLWRSAIMLTIDPLSTEFKFCRFVLSAASWTSCPLCRARSAWNQDNKRKRAFWILTKWLFGLQKTGFCVNWATWLSVLLDPLDRLNTS